MTPAETAQKKRDCDMLMTNICLRLIGLCLENVSRKPFTEDLIESTAKCIPAAVSDELRFASSRTAAGIGYHAGRYLRHIGQTDAMTLTMLVAFYDKVVERHIMAECGETTCGTFERMAMQSMEYVAQAAEAADTISTKPRSEGGRKTQ